VAYSLLFESAYDTESTQFLLRSRQTLACGHIHVICLHPIPGEQGEHQKRGCCELDWIEQRG